MKPSFAIRLFVIVLLITLAMGLANRRGMSVDKANDQGYTLLHAAARDGNPSVASLLLGQGADVNALNKAGETPLDVAERTGHEDVAKILRDAGGTRGK